MKQYERDELDKYGILTDIWFQSEQKKASIHELPGPHEEKIRKEN